MKSLPAGLADPLHLDYPIPWKLLIVFGAVLLAGILFALLLSWIKRPRPATESQPPPLPRPTLGIGFGHRGVARPLPAARHLPARLPRARIAAARPLRGVDRPPLLDAHRG